MFPRRLAQLFILTTLFTSYRSVDSTLCQAFRSGQSPVLVMGFTDDDEYFLLLNSNLSGYRMSVKHFKDDRQHPVLHLYKAMHFSVNPAFSTSDTQFVATLKQIDASDAARLQLEPPQRQTVILLYPVANHQEKNVTIVPLLNGSPNVITLPLFPPKKLPQTLIARRHPHSLTGLAGDQIHFYSVYFRTKHHSAITIDQLNDHPSIFLPKTTTALEVDGGFELESSNLFHLYSFVLFSNKHQKVIIYEVEHHIVRQVAEVAYSQFFVCEQPFSIVTPIYEPIWTEEKVFTHHQTSKPLVAILVVSILLCVLAVGVKVYIWLGQWCDSMVRRYGYAVQSCVNLKVFQSPSVQSNSRTSPKSPSGFCERKSRTRSNRSVDVEKTLREESQHEEHQRLQG